MSLSKLNRNTPRTETQRKFKILELGTLLEQEYIKQAKESKDTKKDSFAPSSFYQHSNGVCPRYWWYAFNGAWFQYESDPSNIATMAYGTEAGKRIASLFDSAGILRGSEVEARLEDPPVFGYIDLIVDWNGEEVVGEVKTTHQGAWTHRATTMAAPAYNMIQLLLYMHIKEIHKGFLLYENRNNQEFVTIPVVMDDENKALVEKVLDWMRTVHTASREPVPPVRPFTRNSKQCKSCPVAETCWNGPDGEVALPVLEVG